MAFQLRPRKRIGDELVRVVRAEIAKAARIVADHTQPVEDRIHVARMTCKRIRAALRLIRQKHPTAVARENARLRHAAATLSAVRDADAMLLTLATLVRGPSRHPAARRFEPVRRALRAHRRTLIPDAATLELRLAQLLTNLQMSGRRLPAGKNSAGDFDVVVSGYIHGYKRARAAFQRARRHPRPGALHEWRKALKNHGYQCRLLRAAWPRVMKARFREISALGECLGQDHDLTVLLDHLGRSGAASDASTRALHRIIATRQKELALQAAILGRRLFADKPAGVGRQLRAWWQATCDEPGRRPKSSEPSH